jgi:hypothetical protein
LRSVVSTYQFICEEPNNMTTIMWIFCIATFISSLLWGLYSLFSIIYPMKHISRRKNAVISLGLSTIFLIGSILIAATLPMPRAADPQPFATLQSAVPGKVPHDAIEVASAADPEDKQPAINKDTLTSGVIPEKCGEEGLALGDVVAVSGEHNLRTMASLLSPRLKNEKASAVLKKTHYHQIDGSTTVRRLCVQSEWTQVQIVSPDWLADVKGWVPNKALRGIESADDGKRIYVDDDFNWDEDTSRYKSELVAIVNRIANENQNCFPIDPSSVAKSMSRSKPRKPVFYVTCGSGPGAYNIWFKPSDAKSGKLFSAKKPLGKNAAANECENAAKAAAIHPSTVNFSRILDLSYLKYANGRARIVSSFTARNGFNLELKFRIDCLFDEQNLVDIQIVEGVN